VAGRRTGGAPPGTPDPPRRCAGLLPESARRPGRAGGAAARTSWGAATQSDLRRAVLMKLAHLADLHLGFRQFDRQTPKGANQREVDVAEVFKRAVDDILEQKPELIVVAGDLFHSVRPTNAAILYCFRQQIGRAHV